MNEPTSCQYCGAHRLDLVAVRIWRNGEQVWIFTCPEKTNPMQFMPDCANNAQASAEG